MNKVSPKSC